MTRPRSARADGVFKEISMRPFLSFVAALLMLSTPALAQMSTAMRGTIVSLSADGAIITAKTRAGEPATVRLKPDVRIVAIVAADLKDVREGAFIGVAAMPDGDNGLRALEVHVFPEAMRGYGQGHRAFDLGPGSSMTNGAVTTRVDAADGTKLTVSYPGGDQTIRVDASTKIVTFAAGEKSELVTGAQIIARGTKAEDGTIDAAAVYVGRGGITPPM
jgi:Domain of unknown function (DUF5666)